jgi:glycine reductase complex component B subunit gamma
VGLVQREIEGAGFSTISLSMIPQLTASAGASRIAAIEHPFGMTLGRPGDVAGQLGVLGAALRAMEGMTQPGAVVHLPFEWRSTETLTLAPPVAPPIARYLVRHPWALPRFLTRMPPPSRG